MRRLSAFLFMIPLLAATALPAAAQGTTEELLSDMVTEEVEPGVFRVVNDGVRDLAATDGPGFPSRFVDVAPDGGVWLSGEGGSSDRLYRLGGDRSFGGPGDRWVPSRHRHFAPDGTLWVEDEYSIHTFADGSWDVRRLDGLFVHDLATRNDGGAWVLIEAEDGEGEASRSVLQLPAMPSTEEPGQWLDGWADLTDDNGWPESIEATPDGNAWLLGGWGDRWLLRHDDQGWQVMDAPTSILRGSELRDLVAGPDGTLWLVGARWRNEGPQPGPALARLDRDGWSTFDHMEAGFDWGQWIGVWGGASVLLDVAPDGALWLNTSDEGPDGHAGVARFDGVSWRRFLDGRSVHDLDVGPDGAVWVRAGDALTEDRVPVDLYVITPEAVAE